MSKFSNFKIKWPKSVEKLENGDRLGRLRQDLPTKKKLSAGSAHGPRHPGIPPGTPGTCEYAGEGPNYTGGHLSQGTAQWPPHARWPTATRSKLAIVGQGNKDR